MATKEDEEPYVGMKEGRKDSGKEGMIVEGKEGMER
jgi:hypothetical protein